MTKDYATGVYVVTTAMGDSFRAWGPDDTRDFCYLHDPVSGYAASGVTEVRPLVVLDPESDEDCDTFAERLTTMDNCQPWTRLQVRTLLRALALKPAEPTGLGAVVRDHEGVVWLRDGLRENQSRPDAWWRAGGVYDRRAWDRISVTEVLSEGWSE